MIIRKPSTADSDRLTCTDCGATRQVDKRQTVVLSAAQSGHRCGDPDWPLPFYTPPGRRTRPTLAPTGATP